MLKNKNSTNESENIIGSTKGNAYSHDDNNVAKNIDAHETPRNSSYIGHIAKETLGLFTGHSENGKNKDSKDSNPNVENNQKLKNTNELIDTTGNASHSNYTYSSMVDPVIDKNDVIQTENNVQEIKEQMKAGEYDSVKNQQYENTPNKESETHITNPAESKHEESKSGGSDSHTRTDSHSGSGHGHGHGILKKLGIHRRSKSESGSDKKNATPNTTSQNDDAAVGNSSDQYFEPTHNLGVDDSDGGRKQDVTKSSDDSYDNKNQNVETSENADKNQGIESLNDLYDNQELEKPGNTYKTGFESSVNKKKDQDTKATRSFDNQHHAPLDEFAMKDQYAKQHEKNIENKQKGEVFDADDYLNPAPVCKNTVSGPTYKKKDLNDQPLAPVLESLRLNESKEPSGYTDELSNPHHNLDSKENTESMADPALKHEDGKEVENENENENQGILGTIYGYLGMQNDETAEGQNINPDHLETNIPGSYYDYENTDRNLGGQTKARLVDRDDSNFEEPGTNAMRASGDSRTDPMKHDKMAGAIGESTPYNYIQDPSDDHRLVSENTPDLKTSENRGVPLMARSATGAATDTAILKTRAGSNHHPTAGTFDNDSKRYFGSDVKNPANNDMLSGATVESTPYRMVQDPNHKEYLQTKNANLLKSKKGINDSRIGTSDLINKDIKPKNYYKLKRDTVSDPAHYISESDNNQFGRSKVEESKVSGNSKGSGLGSDYRDFAKTGRDEGNDEFNSKKVTDNRDNYNTENKQDENWLSYILGRGNGNNEEGPSDFSTKINDDNDYKLKEPEMTSPEAGAGDGVGAGIGTMGTIGLTTERNSNAEAHKVLRDDSALNDEQPIFKRTPARYKENPQYGLQEYKIVNSGIDQKGVDIKQSGSDDLLYSATKRSKDYNIDPKQLTTDDNYHISDAVKGTAGGTLISGAHNTYPKDTQLNQNVATGARVTNANASNITDYNNKYLAGKGVADDTTNRINDTSMPSGGYQRNDAEDTKDARIIGDQSNAGGIASASGGSDEHGHHFTETMQSSKNSTHQKAIPIKSQESDYRSHRKTSSSGGGKNKLMALFGKDSKNNTDVQDVEKTPIKTRGTKYGVIHDEGAKALQESMKSPSGIAKVNKVNKVSNDEYGDLAGGGQVGRRKSWIEKIKDKVT